MKKLILITLIFLINLYLPAQSWQELYDGTGDCWGNDWKICSEILAKAAIAAKEEFGEKSPNYALTINDLGVCYNVLGNYQQALPLLQDALRITGEVLGEKHPDYGERLINLSDTHIELGQYEKALPLIQESLQNTAINHGKQHANYGIRINNLGNLYMIMGQYQRALPLLKEALENTEKSQGKNAPDYGKMLNNLGRLYTNMGDYENALLISQEALDNTAKSQGKQHLEYGERLNNLGNLYSDMNQYEMAIPLLQESLENAELSLGKQHPEYGKRLNNLGILYFSDGQLEKALSFLKEALENAEQNYGKKHRYYGNRLSNLGSLYKSMGRYEEALIHLQKALVVTEQSLGKKNPFYGMVLAHLGLLHREIGQDEKALPFFQEHLENVILSQGKQHPDYGIALNYMANIYILLEQYDSAYIKMLELFQAESNQLMTQFDGLNDRLQISFLKKKTYRFNQISSFLYEHPNYKELHGVGFDQQLLIKGFLQNQRTDLLQGIRNHPDTIVQQQYDEWRLLHRQLTRQYQKPLIQRSDSFDSLRNQLGNLETQLANQSIAFRKVRKQIRWKEVQTTLDQDEAVIEFVHFPYYGQRRKTDSIMYLAFVLRSKDTLPQMIPLFEETDLKKLLTSDTKKQNLDQLYAFRGVKPRKAQPNYKNLADLIWNPIDSLVTDVKTIYYSPSGLLNRMNLEAIPLDKKTLLSDKYELIQMGSTRSLVFEEDETTTYANQHALLLGGIKYEHDTATNQVIAFQSEDPEISGLDRFTIASRSGTYQWEYLEGTAIEVQKIEGLLNDTGYKSELRSGSAATETHLKNINQSPRILHIATHGYFFPDPKEISDSDLPNPNQLPPVQLSDHPMVRSGLILAGANRAWTGNAVPEGQEDGILTAYEISRMDLSNTELVVLSACETGLGDIEGNEGVYGLQRAFKIAGAKYILMSLWQVPDQATQELMTTFYEKWLSGMEIRKAFRSAQRQMRKKYKEPYFWAGFVLVE